MPEAGLPDRGIVDLAAEPCKRFVAATGRSSDHRSVARVASADDLGTAYNGGRRRSGGRGPGRQRSRRHRRADGGELMPRHCQQPRLPAGGLLRRAACMPRRSPVLQPPGSRAPRSPAQVPHARRMPAGCHHDDALFCGFTQPDAAGEHPRGATLRARTARTKRRSPRSHGNAGYCSWVQHTLRREISVAGAARRMAGVPKFRRRGLSLCPFGWCVVGDGIGR